MIPKECKRLAEVDFPIAEVSRHSGREKSIRHGHPSTLHLWWARRPLAACRAMLLALLLPDPCDPLCPEDFKVYARTLLPKLTGDVGSNDLDLRKSLLKFIGHFANWDAANDQTYLDVGRGLVKAAHPEDMPLVVDPFAGGGSIPLEALRLGCDAFASDLNPVACLVLKVMLEEIPRHGPQLADELSRVGAEIKKKAEKELAQFYPKDPDGATPIAYLWARTVRCESPNCGAEIPIYRSPWLSKKGAKRARYFKEADDGNCLALLIESAPLGGPITFRIAQGSGSENAGDGYAKLTATKASGNNANVICPCCGSLLPGNRLSPRTPVQLAVQHGGADVIFGKDRTRVGGATLLAVATLKTGERGRHYRLPTDYDYQALWKAHQRLSEMEEVWQREGKSNHSVVPDEPLPPIGTLGFRVQRYGMLQWGHLFTARQRLALSVLGKAVRENEHQIIKNLLGLVVSRLSDYGSAQTAWVPSGEFIRGTFGRQALPMVWDFSEAVPWTDSSGNFDGALEWVTRVVEALSSIRTPGEVQLSDAIQSTLPDQTADVWFTDPPYYDAIPYSDLSDFFLVWLKRMLPNNQMLRDPFDRSNPLSPKLQEAVQDEIKIVDGRPKDRHFFEEVMAKAFMEGRRVLKEDAIGCVVFAHKTTEGWEALLSGIIRGGLTITASWPVVTERSARLRSQESAALATSVHLVCRRRSEEAPVGDWAELLRELPKSVGDWIERLQGEGIRGADLVFACIGPALEIFSRYRKVETADGSEVRLAEYLEKVWEVVGRAALEQVLGTEEARARNGVAGALEEDARLTALFLWTLQSTNGEAAPSTGTDEAEEEETDDDEEETAAKGKAKGFSLIFDVVRRFAQPLGIDLPKWEDRVIKIEKGTVRLIPVSDRSKQLFGEKGIRPVVEEIESSKVDTGQLLLPGLEEFVVSKVPKKTRGKKVKFAVDDPSEIDVSATTLDRVHAAMLLQAGGQSNALRAFIKAEVERGPDFLRLGNALSALYPKGSEEKRLLDAMLLAVPR